MTPSVNQEGNTNDTPSSRSGTGRLKGNSEEALALSNQVATPCPVCEGYGGEDEPCPECHKQEWRP